MRAFMRSTRIVHTMRVVRAIKRPEALHTHTEELCSPRLTPWAREMHTRNHIARRQQRREASVGRKSARPIQLTTRPGFQRRAFCPQMCVVSGQSRCAPGCPCQSTKDERVM